MNSNRRCGPGPDDELEGTTAPKFRERLTKGETLDDLLPEAFAACREAAKRTKNMRHFDVQIVGGITLHRGNIAEMVTGEGKTLVATLPAVLNALTGEGVHIVTVNDYLARRDCEWMLPIYQAVGITAGYIQADMDPTDRRRAYECDITYGTNSEFGFDYLRDNMKPARWDDERYHPFYRQVQRKLNYAIIDEVDNILIDEARTPLIISGPAFSDVRRYEEADKIARQLAEMETKARAELAAAGTPIDAPLKPGEKRDIGALLRGQGKGTHRPPDRRGHPQGGRLAGVESFYTAGNMEWPHLIDNALKAHHLYMRDRDYLVIPNPETREMSIIIVDTHTGRAMFGRQWTDGLHQAVEAKHKNDGVKIKQETQTLATITLQNFFSMYKKLAGMTGTAMTEANEFWKIYKLDVIAIPTNKVMRRVNHAGPRLPHRSREVGRDHEGTGRRSTPAGRPILVGTTDVAKSEKLAEHAQAQGHQARAAERQAGERGPRGGHRRPGRPQGRRDHRHQHGRPRHRHHPRRQSGDDGLGAAQGQVPEPARSARGRVEDTVDSIEAKEQIKVAGREIAEMGGLHILGTERHDSRRIDNQLRGRAGRQGDPGSSRFYLSLQDDLMRLFAGEWVGNVLTRLGMQEGRGDRIAHGVAPHSRRAEEGRGISLRVAQEPARIRRGDGYATQAHSTASARRS